MIRIVLDTNVVVSAMLRSGGLREACFQSGYAPLFNIFFNIL